MSHVLRKSSSQVWSYDVCSIGKGLGLSIMSTTSWHHSAPSLDPLPLMEGSLLQRVDFYIGPMARICDQVMVTLRRKIFTTCRVYVSHNCFGANCRPGTARTSVNCLQRGEEQYGLLTSIAPESRIKWLGVSKLEENQSGYISCAFKVVRFGGSHNGCSM